MPDQRGGRTGDVEQRLDIFDFTLQRSGHRCRLRCRRDRGVEDGHGKGMRPAFGDQSPAGRASTAAWCSRPRVA